MTLEELNSLIESYDNIISYYNEKMRLTSGDDFRSYYYELNNYKKLKEIAVQMLIQSPEIIEKSQILLNSQQEASVEMSIK